MIPWQCTYFGYVPTFMFEFNQPERSGRSVCWMLLRCIHVLDKKNKSRIIIPDQNNGHYLYSAMCSVSVTTRVHSSDSTETGHWAVGRVGVNTKVVSGVCCLLYALSVAYLSFPWYVLTARTHTEDRVHRARCTHCPLIRAQSHSGEFIEWEMKRLSKS